MATVSLRVLVAGLLVLVAGGMVSLVMVGTETARTGVEDVALGLMEQVAQRVTTRALQVVQVPFSGMRVLQNVYEMGLANPERADGLGYKEVITFNEIVRRSVAGWGNSFYTGTENGHIYNNLGKREDGENWLMIQPPLDQIVEGYPSWTIPCRYQSNCTDPSNALNHRYCMSRGDVLRSNGGEALPYWVEGNGTQLGAGSYERADPGYATWAVAQNPKAQTRTYCRANAQGPKPHCPNAQGCPEFNASYYLYPDGVPSPRTARYLNSVVHFDPRQRWWYRASASLPPWSKYMTDINICVSSGEPCLTATQPVYAMVPGVGATVAE
eukprot:Sspe_Gene.102509::Locus_78061_Transcript_1_1_Confidence_1.000_Length_1343::g.102509::m.102509